MAKERVTAKGKDLVSHIENGIENWYDAYKQDSTFGNRLADKVAREMGSWRFIIIQTIFVFIWMILNIVGFMHHWDVYPFILLNLLFSTQAAYAAPIIMMSQNRQSERDRKKAEANYKVNLKSKDQLDKLSKLHIDQKEELDKIYETVKLILEKK